jgi:hypothetical protein
MAKRHSWLDGHRTSSVVHGLFPLSLPPPPLIHFSHFSFPPHRHLAETWASMYLPPYPKRRLISSSKPTASRSTVEHLVLLNLLGAPHPLARFYFPDTAWLLTSLSAQGHRSATQASLELPCSAVVFQPQSRDFLMRGSPSEYSRRLRQPHWIAVSQIRPPPRCGLADRKLALTNSVGCPQR